MSRRRSRNPHDKRVAIYGENTSLGWKVIKRMEEDAVQRLVDRRRARHVIDRDTGKLMGYQLCEPEFFGNGVVSAPSRPSSAAISQSEVIANAGTAFRHSRSRTATMTEAEKTSRIHPRSGRLMAAEDFVERSVAKVRAFERPVSRTTLDRSVTVYPSGMVTGQYRKKA